MRYTLKDFGEEFRQLLMKVANLGFDTDVIGEMVDSVLAADWEEPVTDDMVPDHD